MKRNLGLTAAFRQAKWLAALGLTLAALALSLVLDLSGAIQPYRLKTLDTLFRHLPLPAASPEVVVVTVDQSDLDFFKTQGVTWPWPRELYAPLIDYCRWAGAKAVIFDVLYTEASSYGAEDDKKFAQAAAAAGNVALPFFLTREAKPPNPSEADLLKQAGLAIPGPAPGGQPAYKAVITPIPPLLAAAGALGNVETSPDPDGIFRRVPLVAPFKEEWLPTLGFGAFHRFGAPGPRRLIPAAIRWGTSPSPWTARGGSSSSFAAPAAAISDFPRPTSSPRRPAANTASPPSTRRRISPASGSWWDSPPRVYWT
jgi:CHASE2 domain-containing sensor protein